MNNGQQTTVCGMPFWMTISEGLVVFSHINGIYGAGERISVHKCSPTGLIYVNAESSKPDKTVAACHIAKAVEIAKHYIGPDHFETLEAEEEYNRLHTKVRNKS